MSDIQILINGEALDLAEDASVSLVFNNSLLDAEILQGSYSLPFFIPATGRNKRILKFMEVIEGTADMEMEQDCILVYEVLVVNARIKVRPGITPKGYPVSLFTDIGSIAEKLKTIKINELDLDIIPLPFETRPTVSTEFRVQIPGAVSPLVVFYIWRQDFSSWRFPVQWTGDLTAFLAELVSRITTPRDPVPVWDLAATYAIRDLVEYAGFYWESNLAGLTGKTPKDYTTYDPLVPYVAEDLVDDGVSVFEAIQASLGVPTSDTDYWLDITEQYWIPICSIAGWPAAWLGAITPKWYLYDDPAYAFDVDAEFFKNTLYLYDNAVGASPFDYILMWSQTWGDLLAEAGLQNIGSPTVETNFRMPINRMLQKQLGKKWPEVSYAFLPFRDPLAFDDTTLAPTVPTREYVNYFVDGFYPYGEVTSDGARKRFYSPQVAVGHVLRKIFEELAVNYEDSMLIGSPECFDRLQIYNVRAAVKYVREIGADGYFTFPFQIKLSDHLPPVLTGEFINALRQFLFLGFVFNASTKTFKAVRLKDVVMAAASKDWTSKADPDYNLAREDPKGFTLSYSHDQGDEMVKSQLPDISTKIRNADVPDFASLPSGLEEIGCIRLVLDEEIFYLAQWSVANVLTWIFFSKYLVSMKIGAGQTTRKPAISTLLDERLPDDVALPEFSIDRSWQVPSVGQALAIPDLEISSPYSLRIFFNWGLQEDSDGELYPLGSGTNKTYDDSVLGPLSLRYDSDAGIYEQLGKEWLRFLQDTKKVTRDIRMTSLDIARLSQDDTIRVDRIDYLWKSFKATLPLKKPAEFELWKK